MNSIHVRGRVSATALIIIAAIALGGGLWIGSKWFGARATPVLQTAVMYPSRLVIPDFTLQGADNRPLTQADLQGHWTVIFFGFTHCPDVCPATLAAFKQVWNELSRKGVTERVRFVFISVDPQRDTSQKLASYVGFFNKDFLAATGSDEELTRLTRSLGLVYARIPDPAGGYSVDHSASAVIIDPQGRRAGLFRPPFSAGPISADLLTLTGSP